MSGPIRSIIGPIHKRLLKIIEFYKTDATQFLTPLGDIDNDNLLSYYNEIKRYTYKFENSIHSIESAQQKWITLITSLKDSDERARESRIYDDFIIKHGDFNAALITAKDSIDELTKLKDSFKNEILARKEENNTSDNDEIDQPVGPHIFTPIERKSHFSNNTLHNAIADRLTTSAHLPPVTIQPFHGDITKWPSFWETFNSMVHSQNLSECIKFYHLKSLLRGEASQLIAGLNTDSYNYPIAISLLTDAYGNKEDICHKLRAQIISFNLIGQGASAMLKSYHFLVRIFRQLQSLGDNIDTSTYAQIIETRFPKHLMMKVIPRIHIRPITAQILLDKIGEILKQEATVDRIYEDNKPILYNNRFKNNHFNFRSNFDHSSTYKNDESILPSSTFAAANAIQKDNISTNKNCAYCLNNNHLSTNCKKYSIPEIRKKRSIELQLCFNCLGSHNYKECRSKKTCRICKRKHHTSLCFTSIEQTTHKPLLFNEHTYGNKKGHASQKMRTTQVSFAPTTSDENCPTRTNNCFSGTVIHNNTNFSSSPSITSSIETLLMCAYITVSNPNDIEQCVNVLAFFDTGSNRSYISSDLANTLKLSSLNIGQLQINTFANKSPTILNTSTHSLAIHFNNSTSHNINVSSLENMTSHLRFVSINNENIASIKKQFALKLPPSHVKPSILIGSDYMWDILDGYSYSVLPSGFLLLETKIGYLLTGKGRLSHINNNIVSNYTTIEQPNKDFNSLLENFWKLESISVNDKPELSDDEESMRIFSSTVTKSNNRYVVKWPWKSSNPKLPNNLALCISRLHSVIKKLHNDNELLQKYDAIIKEQLSLEIIEQVPNNKVPDSPIIHYLPHHPVVNMQKSTTKVRIVYDASAKTKNNSSLNDCLYRGPVLLPDLCGVLLRFRLAPIAIIADVEKAFLQINLAPPDREVTRFLWLKDITKPPTLTNIITYRFTRVPFGIISSPFLLAATVRHHLEKNDTLIAHNLWRNLYVDNAFMAAKNTEEAKVFYEKSRKLFTEASMNLREFISNDKEFNEFLKNKGHDIQENSKILGIKWNTSSDTLQFHLPSFNTSTLSKRTILKYIASIYDPLGLISPILVLPKLFLQKLWKSSLAWDDSLPNDLNNEWTNLVKDWKDQNPIIDRLILIHDSDITQLHCFVDASGHTYGAVAYLRWLNLRTNIINTKLIFAKNRLCPIQGMTIPKLELMAILIGARIVNFLHEQLDIPLSQTHLWSDSSCALQWLTSTKDISTFIKNRIVEIRDNSNITFFHHLPSQDNPADIISRGSTPSELVDCNLWWEGPPWLRQVEEQWPNNINIHTPIILKESDNVTEEAQTHTATITNNFTFIDPQRYSSFSSMINVICYILFFIFKCANKNQLDIVKTLHNYYCDLPITAKTRKIATLYAFKFSQESNPPSEEEIKQFRLQRDELGIWRCHSRLDLKNSPYESTFPIFLNKSCHITNLFILHIHNNLAHSGPNATIANLRQLVWVPQARTTVKRCIRKLCMACRRTLAKPYPLPSMPPYPHFRMNKSRPFSHIGVDYMGPLSFKKNDSKLSKVWICLITCLTTRAIHCDVVFSLTAEAFLHIIRRFISRRGLPQYILSDNGSQFQLASKALLTPSLSDYCATKGIEWKFITELAPWQGGIYERLIGIFKQSFRRAVGRRLLKIDDLISTTYEIEAIVNSRPLTYYQEDTSFKPLRPIDFILPSNSCISSPTILYDKDEDYLPRNNSRHSLLKTWSQSQICSNNFWNIWKNEYLHSLREINRFEHKLPRSVTHNTPRVNDIVILRNDNIPRVHWKLAKICELPKNDTIRSARVLLPNGKILNRAINFLYPLEIQDSFENSKNETSHTAMPTTKRSNNLNSNTILHHNLRRSKRIAMMPPKSYVYFIYFLSIISTIVSADSKCDYNVTSLSLVHLQECATTGIGIYSASNGFYCFRNLACADGTFLRLKNNEHSCGFPCECPKWASHCSTYTGKKIEQTKQLVTDFKLILHKVAPIFCSEFTNTNKCNPSLTSKTFYQIQLYDFSIHLLHDIHLKISDTDILDEPICLGNDTTVTGTSRYCQNFPCTNNSKKFCYYPQTPITYIILQNYTIPVKAWGVTTRSFYDFENTLHTHYCTECSFICLINGSLLIQRPPIHKLTIDICTSNSIHHNFCQIINDTYLTVFDIPQELLTNDHKINLKIWNNGILIYENTKTCLSIDLCKNIDCTFCVRYILQCTSKLDIFMGLLLIWICLLFITTIFNILITILKLTYFLKFILQTILQIPFYFLKLISYICTRKRVTTSTKRRFRTSQRSIKHNKLLPFKFTLTILITLIHTSNECTEVSSIQADTTSCIITSSDSIECIYDSSSLITVTPNGQTICLSLLDTNKQVIGSLHITIPSIQLICRHKSHFFTRDHKFLYPSIKRCKLMGSCSKDYCEKLKPHDRIAEFSNEINNKNGFSYCMESCGCFACGCFICTPACLFYRIIPEYVSTKIYEIFSCSTFDTKINTSITLTTNNHQSESNTVILSPGHIARWNNISINIVSTSLPNIPILGYSFLRNIHSNQIRLLTINPAGQPQAGMIGQLQCKSKFDAERSNCIFDPNVCKCHPTEDTVNCHCINFNHAKLFKDNEYTLPLSLGNINLRTDKKHIIKAEVTSSTSIQILITANNLRAITKRYDSSCNATTSSFSGCYHCNLGALGNITCYTDFGEIYSELQCNDQHFTIKCSPNGHSSQITLYSSTALLQEECVVRCPKTNFSFMTHGTLQYIPSIILPQIEQYQSATPTYSFKTFHNSYNLPLSFESLIKTLKNFNPIATFTTALYSFSTIAAICVILWISVMMYPFFKLITSHLLLYPIYKILPPHMNTTSSKERKNI